MAAAKTKAKRRKRPLRRAQVPAPPLSNQLDRELAWMEARLRIMTKAAELVFLEPNAAQVTLAGVILDQIAAGCPVRIIILKARQMGMSTFVEALLFTLTYLYENFRAFVCAHDDDSSGELFLMTRLFEEYLPADEKRATLASSRKEIIFAAPHNARMQVQTAGKRRLGRSMTFNALHASEVAFWTDAKTTLNAVLQSVPDLPGTFVFLESTANGVGGEFYNRWKAAEELRRRNPGTFFGYMPIFLSWLIHSEYRRAAPEGYRWGELDDDEIELRDNLAATPEQLYWRRCTIAEKCGGDVELFKQEYPSTPDEAFRMSGRRAIAEQITRRHRKTVETGQLGRFAEDARVPGGVVRILKAFDERAGQQYPWRFYRERIDEDDYVVGGDVSEGIASDLADEKSDTDWSAGVVLNRVTLETAATIRCKLDADVYGIELLLAARYFNQGWVTPEINSAGTASLLAIKRRGYHRLYNRETADDKVDPADATQLGWRTTTGNRSMMIDDYIAACRPDPSSGFHGKIAVLDADLVAEEEEMIVDLKGKRQHRPGGHDDLMFGIMIAWQLHRRCPRTRRVVQRDYTPKHRTPTAHAGEIDYGVPEEAEAGDWREMR